MKIHATALVLVLLFDFAQSQSLESRYQGLGEMFVPELTSAPFPHSSRMLGHTYRGENFTPAMHYSDSRVAIFIPNGFNPLEPVNLVIYFHGWRNNINKACEQFELIEQFAASKKNAVFVFPEGPRDAPDSGGGKMEDQNGLKNLVSDLLKYLQNEGKIASTALGQIVLAGHSGAYRAIAFSLDRGGLTGHVSDIILFDALYWNVDMFSDWIRNYNGRFIDIYTEHGGTMALSLGLMDSLSAWKIPFIKTEELDLKRPHLTDNRLVFIHSDLSHNQVIAERRQFHTFLATSRIASLPEKE